MHVHEKASQCADLEEPSRSACRVEMVNNVLTRLDETKLTAFN